MSWVQVRSESRQAWEITLKKPINWRKELTSRIVALQYCALAALSYMWAAMDLSRIISMLPRNFHVLLPASNWLGTALQPYEKIANLIKQVATVIDVPNHLLACHPAELKKKNFWARSSTVTGMIQMTIDSFILIPFRWNMLDLAKWTALIGRTPFMIERLRDSFMIVSILCRVKATYINYKNADAQILKIRKRIAADGPLSKLQAALDSSQISIINQIKDNQVKDKTQSLRILKEEILNLKNEREFFQSKLASAAPIISSNLTQKIDDLNKKICAKSEKRARIELRTASARPDTLDDLREWVAYKRKKAEMKISILERAKELSIVSTRYELSKLIVILFHIAIVSNLTLFVAPALTLTAATVSNFLYLGRFAFGVIAGTACVSYIITYIRYSEPLRLPQTHFVKVP